MAKVAVVVAVAAAGQLAQEPVLVQALRVVDQVVKLLNKLVEVIEIQDFREGEYVDRELVLLKIKVDSKARAEVMQICDIFRAKIVDVQPKNLTIEITGNESKVSKFIALMETFGIVDLTRTGKVAIARK